MIMSHVTRQCTRIHISPGTSALRQLSQRMQKFKFIDE